MLSTVVLIAPSFASGLPKTETQFFINSKSDLRVQQLKRVIATEAGLISPDEEPWPALLDRFELRLSIDQPTTGGTSCLL